MATDENLQNDGASPADPQESEIYSELAQHQQSERWFGQKLALTLGEFAERFNSEFKLEIPELALRIDYLTRTCYGHFRYGHNGFGLRGEIAINAHYLGDRELWEILGTLLHEEIHAWQQAHGSPGEGNYHNAEFRNKAKEFGLIVNHYGVTQYEYDSCFTRLIRRYGIEVPVLSADSEAEGGEVTRQLLETKPRQAGTSKMKKWTCGCGINLRCARAEFYAQCLNCGQIFQKQP